VSSHLGRHADTSDHAFNALNTALMEDGAFVYAAAAEKEDRVVSIVHISDSRNGSTMHQPRNLVVLANGASATIVEAYYSAGDPESFTNVVSEVHAGSQSSLRHIRIQDLNAVSAQNNFTQATQLEGSNTEFFTLTFNGRLVRNSLHCRLEGRHAHTALYGLYTTSGSCLTDNHTRIDHLVPDCTSNELYKGVLRDRSTAVFNGKVIVHEKAQKTQAYQRNQNIVLSAEATVNTKPQLEIFADNVKCTHGATVGELDPESLFYLRSRGIGEEAARGMLLRAFASDITDRIPVAGIRAYVQEGMSPEL
jgi:Fe-S cluster assembly protein SufD